LVIQASKALAEALKQKLNERILGPEFPMIKRIQGMYQQEIKIKFEKTLSDKKMKEYLLALLDQFYKNVRYKKIKITVDVDPY
jgi:primosomal protein N' (replication factor Y)